MLGIFGRYGVHAAALWPLNANEDYNYGALAMFRNYDGQGSGFGDTEVGATTSDKVKTSIYASIDQADPSHLVIVAINKGRTATPSTLSLTGISSDDAAVYTLTSASSRPQAAPGLVGHRARRLQLHDAGPVGLGHRAGSGGGVSRRATALMGR